MTKTIVPDRQGIERAAEVLMCSGLVGFPTETVYGLGAIATDDKAVTRIFLAKGRPTDNPLIVHVASIAEASAFCLIDDRARALAEAYWPGPLTLVLPLKVGTPISRMATAGLATVAVRIPSHPVAQKLLKQLELPIAAPSANRSGAISPTRAEHVIEDLDGAIDLVLEAGGCPVGLESTVVDLSETGARILRPGGLPTSAIEKVIGTIGGTDPSTIKRSPGMTARHYAPNRPVRLNATSVRPGEGLLGFGRLPRHQAKAVRNLSQTGDLAEAAGNLFHMLRELDSSGVETIAVMPIPYEGLGEAINDRLRRAAEIEQQSEAA